RRLVHRAICKPSFVSRTARDDMPDHFDHHSQSAFAYRAERSVDAQARAPWAAAARTTWGIVRLLRRSVPAGRRHLYVFVAFLLRRFHAARIARHRKTREHLLSRRRADELLVPGLCRLAAWVTSRGRRLRWRVSRLSACEPKSSANHQTCLGR